MSVLSVEGLGVRYGELVALDSVSWSVGAGELLGIIGPNGAGKSSCYDAVTAMVPRQGRVSLRGEDITAVPAHRLAERGLKRAFQQNAFFHELSVLENMLSVLQRTAGNAAARRALWSALAEHRGPLEMAQEVRKRLAAVERSSSWLDRKRRDALLVDLDRQRQAMVGPIADHDPDLARIYS